MVTYIVTFSVCINEALYFCLRSRSLFSPTDMYVLLIAHSVTVTAERKFALVGEQSPLEIDEKIFMIMSILFTLPFQC